MLPGPPPVNRCFVCSSVLAQFNLLSGLMGSSLTRISCNAQQGCTCAIPVTSSRSSSQANIFIAHSKDDVRSLMSNRPNTKSTCLLVPSRAVTGLRHTVLMSLPVIHTFPSDSPIGVAINSRANKPSIILVFHVPPDPREVGMDKSFTLAAAKLPESRMKSVYDARVKSTDIKVLFDSGASRCFMGIKTVHHLGLTMRPSRLKSVATAAGQSTPTLGEVTFPLRLDAGVLEITAHVLPIDFPQ